MATLDEEDLVKGSEDVYNLVCIPCHRDDTTLPAVGYCIDCQEHLCYTCYKHHRKPAPSRHHTLQDRDTMPSTQQLTDTPILAATIDSLTTPCPHHKKEKIKLYCHDHELLLCSICVALEHTKPCHVDYIPDISGEMIDSFEYKITMQRIDHVLKKFTTLKTETSSDADKSKDSLNDALQELKKYRQEINNRIDELQKEIEAKILAFQQQNDESMKTVDTICEDVKNMLKVTCDSLKQAKQADKLFIEIKVAQKQLCEYEQSINSLSAENTIDVYKYIPNQAITDVLQKEKMIGNVSSVFGDQITPKYLDKIYIKTSQDSEMSCSITGMTVLPPDRLVLADNQLNSIKLVDVNSRSVISQLSLGTEDDDAPYDITSTSSTQVAVTVPERKCIQFILVINKLIMQHKIQTDGECKCICCHQDKLIVTYMGPDKLEILDMDGAVIRTVETDSTGSKLFRLPDYVQASSNSIYVSDEKSIIMLNWQGEVTRKFEDIEYPRGLALLGDGSLIVTACMDSFDRVFQVSADCTNTRFILHGVTLSNAVCVGDGGHKLYIGRAWDFDDEDGIIRVYNM